LYITAGWWFGTWLLFSPLVGMMIQSDFHIFQGGETTNQAMTGNGKHTTYKNGDIGDGL
jgi:hypothetical protein